MEITNISLLSFSGLRKEHIYFECYTRFHLCPQPEKAFEVYQLGMKKNPKSAALASKTGKALIKSHYYFKVSLR